MGLIPNPDRVEASTAHMIEALPVQRLPADVPYRHVRIGIGGLVAVSCFVGYLLASALLVFGAGVILGDSLSRVENAARILYSHDPHLAAIGFAWGPLPTLAELPLVSLRFVWPQLVTFGFAANITSAAFMTAAVYQLYRLLDDLRITRWVSVAIVITFAANPMIVFYAANGMSEAPFLFFLMLAVRHLGRWLWTGDIGSLALAGIGLGAGYLCRYEGAAAGVAAIALVATVSYPTSQWFQVAEAWRWSLRCARAGSSLPAGCHRLVDYQLANHRPLARSILFDLWNALPGPVVRGIELIDVEPNSQWSRGWGERRNGARAIVGYRWVPGPGQCGATSRPTGASSTGGIGLRASSELRSIRRWNDPSHHSLFHPRSTPVYVVGSVRPKSRNCPPCAPRLVASQSRKSASVAVPAKLARRTPDHHRHSDGGLADRVCRPHEPYSEPIIRSAHDSSAGKSGRYC